MVYKRYKWTIIWTSVILVLCFLPSNKFPDSDWFALLKFDKLVHFGMYFLLYVLLRYEVFIKRINKPYEEFFILTYCVFWAGVSELIQEFFIPTRFGDIYDFIANSAGIIVGSITWRLWLKNKVKERLNEGTV
jgi:VanZ family protein